MRTREQRDAFGRTDEQVAFETQRVGRTLREFNAAGPCIPLGEVTRATAKRVSYTDHRGRTRHRGGYSWHADGSKEPGRGTLLHVEPCHSCTDNPNTQYPHGYMD